MALSSMLLENFPKLSKLQKLEYCPLFISLKLRELQCILKPGFLLREQDLKFSHVPQNNLILKGYSGDMICND